MASGDSTQAGLAGNPFPALAEMQKLAAIVRKELPKVHSPCLILHSSHDDIADINTNAKVVESNVSAPTKFVPLDDSYHMITIDRQRRQVIEYSIDFFEKIVASYALDSNRQQR